MNINRCKKQVRYFCGRIALFLGGLGCFRVVWGVSTDRAKRWFPKDGVRRVDTNQDYQTISESVPLACPFRKY